MTGYDFNRTSYIPLKGNIVNPQIMWEFNYPAATTNHMQNPVLVEDINNDGIMEVCSAAKDGYVRCFVALNGTSVWNYSLGGNPGAVPGLIANLYNNSERQIIQGERGGYFVILNGSNGNLIWNVSLPSLGVVSLISPLAYNLTGDEEKELVLQSSKGLFAFYNNGTEIWNYTEDNFTCGTDIVVADFDKDGEAELIFLQDNNITFLELNGTFLKKVSLPSPPSTLDAMGLSVVDLNSDGFLDFVSCAEDGYCWGVNNSGSLIWTKLVGTHLLEDRLAIADIDNDSKPEIIVGSYHRAVTALNGEDGSILWESYVSKGSTSSPVIADIDNDGELEIIKTGTGTLSFLNARYGYSEREIGINTYPHHSPPSLADVDNDGFVEIFVTGRDYHNYFPIEHENKIVAISLGGDALYSSHKSSEILNNNSLNWKTKGKNTLFNNDIIEYFGEDTTPIITSFSNLSDLKFSIVADDINEDGFIEIFALNESDIYSLFYNGSIKWSSNLSKEIVGSPLIADPNDDNIDEIMILSNTTLYVLNSSTGEQIFNYTHAEDADLNKEPFFALDFDGDNNTEILYKFIQHYTKSIIIEYDKTVRISSILCTAQDIKDMPIFDFNKDGILDSIEFGQRTGKVIMNSLDDQRNFATGMVNTNVMGGGIVDLNNDSFLDVVIYGINNTYIAVSGEYSGFLTQGGPSGIYTLLYNSSIGTLENYWNYSSGNITTGIAAGDINGDGSPEILFGDASDTFFALNYSGSQLWNVSLDKPFLAPPMIVRVDEEKIIIATTNTSLFFFNSTGGLFYRYNSSSNFTYSPIIVDLDNDCRGELLISNVAGEINMLDFDNYTNASLDTFLIEVGDTVYDLDVFGKGLCGGVLLDMQEYSSNEVLFDLNGVAEGIIQLTNLDSSSRYLIAQTSSSSQTDSYLVSDSNGAINISYSINRLTKFRITPSPIEESASGGFPLFKPSSEQLKEGYSKLMGKNWEINFYFQTKSHELRINDIQNHYVTITVSSEPQTFNLSINETKKLNLNNDGYYDFQVLLKNIQNNNYADLEFKEIHEEIPAEEQEKQKEPSKVEEEIKDWVWIVGGIIILIIIGIVTRKLGYKKKKVKKKKK